MNKKYKKDSGLLTRIKRVLKYTGHGDVWKNTLKQYEDEQADKTSRASRVSRSQVSASNISHQPLSKMSGTSYNMIGSDYNDDRFSASALSQYS